VVDDKRRNLAEEVAVAMSLQLRRATRSDGAAVQSFYSALPNGPRGNSIVTVNL
jgi:hypothetical protein